MTQSEIFEVAIVPLPDVVLFPRTLLALRLAEPGCQAMAADCLAGDRRLGVVLMKGPNGSAVGPAESQRRPAIHKVLGVGVIVDHENLPDGTCSLKLEGACRAMILDELPGEFYRSARVEVVKDYYDVDRREELEDSRSRLARQSRLLAKQMPDFADLIDRILSTARHPGILADQLAHHFVADLYDRQSILGEYDVIRRVDLVAIQMESLNRRVRREQRKAS